MNKNFLHQYSIPSHICQWCYKTSGRFIIDCLCFACQVCFQNKKNWFIQGNKCYFCSKPSLRKTIDVKLNPQQAGLYFQSPNAFLKNTIRVNEFQQDITKKYCKHLEGKIKKYEEMMSLIGRFLKQFPQFKIYFQQGFNQLNQQRVENQNISLRSKSMQSNLGAKGGVIKQLKPNQSEKSIANSFLNIDPQLNNMKGSSAFVNESQNEFLIQNNPQNDQQTIKNNNILNGIMKNKLQKQAQRKTVNQFSKPPLNPNLTINQNIGSKNHTNNKVPYNPYPVPTYNMKNYNKINLNKNSDPPGGYRQNLNINNNLNMQTAMRSIKSEQERKYTIPVGINQNQNGIINSKHQINNQSKKSISSMSKKYQNQEFIQDQFNYSLKNNLNQYQYNNNSQNYKNNQSRNNNNFQTNKKKWP